MSKDLPSDILSNGGNGTEQGGTGCQCDMLAEKYDLSHRIIEYSKKEKVLTDKQINGQNLFV